MLRIPSLVLTVGLAIASAEASVPATVCSERPPAGLGLGYYAYDTADLSPVDGTTDIDRFSVDAGLPGGERLAFGFSYRGTHLNEAGADLQTNGYLHTFMAALDLHSGGEHASWRFSLAPVLSGSSNVVKDRDEWETDAWQLLAALVMSRRVNERLALRYGACADHAFGAYRVYPLVALDWEIGPRWTASIGYPRMHAAFALTDGLQMRLGIAPVGNAWLVKDRALENQSMLTYESWSLDWELRWSARPDWQFAAGLGYEFDSSYEATLADGRRGRLDSGSVLRVGLRLLWAW